MDFGALRKALHDAKMRVNMAWDTYLELEIRAKVGASDLHGKPYLSYCLDVIRDDVDEAAKAIGGDK